MVGIVEEQHPDRARLFMQRKRIERPILVDPLNLLGVPYVPITLAIDEHGIVRVADFEFDKTDGLEEKFPGRKFDPPESPAAVAAGARNAAASRPDLAELEAAPRRGCAAAWREYAGAVVLWGGTERLGEAIEAYGRSLRLEPGDGATHFRLGVAYRLRPVLRLRGREGRLPLPPPGRDAPGPGAVVAHPRKRAPALHAPGRDEVNFRLPGADAGIRRRKCCETRPHPAID